MQQSTPPRPPHSGLLWQHSATPKLGWFGLNMFERDGIWMDLVQSTSPGESW